MADTKVRPGRAHKDTAKEAGLGSFSFVSVVAGVMCAYGAFTLVAAVAGALLDRFDVDTEFRSNDWSGSGAVAALASVVVLLLAYFLGGYVAGRMARRAGGLNGLSVAILSLVLGAAFGAIVSALTDDADVTRNLRSIGVPTTSDQVTGVAIAGLIASLAAVLVGGFFGGVYGERWHARLARKVADPSIGPAAEARERAERADEDRRDHIERDTVVRREVEPDPPPEPEPAPPTPKPEVDVRDGATSTTSSSAGWSVPTDDSSRS